MSQKIEWQVYDKAHRRHSADWYWAVGIIATAIGATSLILGNVLFAVLIGISTVALFLRTLQKPRLIRYELAAKGIRVNTDFTPYQSLESFWLDESYGSPTLLFKAKNLFTPLIIIPLGDADAEAVHAHLASLLPEVELHEPLSKKIMEYLGF